MYCTKCGKEIPDGEDKVCEECKTNIVEEAKEESTPKTEKFEKVENDKKTTKKGKLNILCIILVVLAIILGRVCCFTSINKVGNTIGNIRNYGYAADQGNWIYFLAPNENSTEVGIFRIRKDGTNQEQLYMSSTDIVSLNVYRNYIYFIGVSSEAPNEEDEFDNKIYRMKLDGSDLQIINDNEFNDNCYEIYVVDNSVYYIGTGAEVCKMDLNGENKTTLLEEGTGYLGITEDYIIYNKVENENTTEYVTYIMNRDGSNQRAIIPEKRLYSVNIEDGYIYYADTSKHIYRTKIDSGVEELLYDNLEAYNLNTRDGYAYYLNYKDQTSEVVCLYRIKLDGQSEIELVKELASYSSFIDIVGDWVIYMDSSNTEGFIDLVKVDGSDEVRLYTLNYEKYYELMENNDYSDVSVDSTSASEGENTVTNEIVNNVADNVTNTVEKK